jgi:hypothetical protein
MHRIFIRTVFLIAALSICSRLSGAVSVSGRAVQKNGSNPGGPCRATLRAEPDRRGAPEADLHNAPDGKTNFSEPLDQSGSFQFIHVQPGKHVLVIECREASAVRELDVGAAREFRIDRPLVLENLTLEVVITPKVDPEAQPWQITVDATMPHLRRIADNAATTNGRWTGHGLVAGNYRVNIASSDGKPWLQRFFNLSSERGQLALRLPFIRISGDVRLSTQPMSARLIFHNEAGGEPATLESDNNGYFQGLVPVTPGAQETEWTVEARSENPPISRRLLGVKLRTDGETTAWLDLALPMFAVHGSVVSSTGRPQGGVQVTFENTNTGARTSTATGDAGGFEVQDLSPGQYTAVAESIDGVSDGMPFVVKDGIESELKLVLNSSERVSVYVVSSQGPIADASVQVWIPPGVPHWFAHTEPDGHFEVKVPPGTTELGLAVEAQGYAVKLTRMPISRNSESSNANTVTLDTSGGMLVLNLMPPGHLADTSLTPYLVHRGAIEAVGALVSWGINQADPNGTRSAVLQTIEPGVYSLCWVMNPAELSALWLGAPQSNRCRTGSVEQGETLTLSLP